MKLAVGIGLDIVMVLVFAVIGRASHGEADSVAGVLTTAWPFLAATIVGWAIVLLGPGRYGRRRPFSWLAGVTVLVSTVVLGMALRLLAGGTAAWPFWIVALVTLGILLLGWRLAARLILARMVIGPWADPNSAQPAAAITSSEASKLE